MLNVLTTDPDLIRNQSRLDVRTQELIVLGVTDPAKAFRERNLKPKQDNRLVMVPKVLQKDQLVVIQREENHLTEKSNFGLRLERGPEDLNSYDNVLKGDEPGSKNSKKKSGKSGAKNKSREDDSHILGNGQQRLHSLPRRSMYTLFSKEQKEDAPPPLMPS